ncbi:MAG: helix-turn-helix transcriptional regulator [Lysobacter sp.]|nr:helix-turn-helix transcriptional regulator [Lysobacter sp.]MDQ3270447.1 helix-turn-helix domain-containing protein [Pseudomonadota bacterium]
MGTESSRSGIYFYEVADPASMGRKVRECRRRHGLTQGQLAGLSGTGLRFVSELERGKPSVSLNKTMAVLGALGLRLEIVASQS